MNQSGGNIATEGRIAAAAGTAHARDDRRTLVGEQRRRLRGSGARVYACGVTAARAALIATRGRIAAGAASTAVGKRGEDSDRHLDKAAAVSAAGSPGRTLTDVIAVVDSGD
ncbi:hypothetical protein D9M72_573480 [compost metagenome]